MSTMKMHVTDLPPDLRNSVQRMLREHAVKVARAIGGHHSDPGLAAQLLLESLADLVWPAVIEAYKAGLGDQTEAAADAAAIRRVGALLAGKSL